MRALHRGLLLVLMFGLVAAGAVVAQHGRGEEHSGGHDGHSLEQHLDQVAADLALSTDQRFKLEDAIEQTHELMREFHHLHADLMAELNEDQADALNRMVHGMLGDFFGHRGCGSNCGVHGLHHADARGHGSERPKHTGHAWLHGRSHGDRPPIEQ